MIGMAAAEQSVRRPAPPATTLSDLRAPAVGCALAPTAAATGAAATAYLGANRKRCVNQFAIPGRLFLEFDSSLSLMVSAFA